MTLRAHPPELPIHSVENIRPTTRSNNIASTPERRVAVIAIRESINNPIRADFRHRLHLTRHIDSLLYNTSLVKVPPSLYTVLHVKKALVAASHDICASFSVQAVEAVLRGGVSLASVGGGAIEDVA